MHFVSQLISTLPYRRNRTFWDWISLKPLMLVFSVNLAFLAAIHGWKKKKFCHRLPFAPSAAGSCCSTVASGCPRTAARWCRWSTSTARSSSVSWRACSTSWSTTCSGRRPGPAPLSWPRLTRAPVWYGPIWPDSARPPLTRPHLPRISPAPSEPAPFDLIQSDPAQFYPTWSTPLNRRDPNTPGPTAPQTKPNLTPPLVSGHIFYYNIFYLYKIITHIIFISSLHHFFQAPVTLFVWNEQCSNFRIVTTKNLKQSSHTHIILTLRRDQSVFRRHRCRWCSQGGDA